MKERELNPIPSQEHQVECRRLLEARVPETQAWFSGDWAQRPQRSSWWQNMFEEQRRKWGAHLGQKARNKYRSMWMEIFLHLVASLDRSLSTHQVLAVHLDITTPRLIISNNCLANGLGFLLVNSFSYKYIEINIEVKSPDRAWYDTGQIQNCLQFLID